MDLYRKHERIVVDIAVTLTAVLGSYEARIVDLSPTGLQIVGATLPKGARFQIEYQGQSVYAQCMWSEIDRLGARFPFLLTDGPLYDILMLAAAPTAEDRTGGTASFPATARAPYPIRRNGGPVSYGAPMPGAVFGRRRLS